MKREIGPAVVVTALAGMLLVIGLVIWRLFGASTPATDTPETRAEAKRWVEAFKSQRPPPGQNPAAPGAGNLPITTSASPSK
jgi:hypothetical protein